MIAQAVWTAVKGYAMVAKVISVLSVGIFVGAAIVEILDIRSKIKALRRSEEKESKEREAKALKAWVDPNITAAASEA